MRGEEQERRRVTECVEAVLEALNITFADVELKFSSRRSEDGDICETLAANWEYRTAEMEWFLMTTAGMTDLELRRTAVHEVVHVLLAPMETLIAAKDGSAKHRMCELAVENVARAILEVLPEEGA